ncbi:hypothetical protein PAXRUDRAFT_300573 [Paxillus rubicundulus Ve08.2h10]|uniref:Unplaced genomic scaffold scaffold_159, whole genome shotgun sequence n=1 Tax=Paxillus rubicundulus Ve08.2h10 TaxID=930991 RepID=A0A0D0EAE8_9AGAM|nr:hypothetical protein PAXRUDRAFT_300573 [Paxillus rubicundulus Ve08.2h10]
MSFGVMLMSPRDRREKQASLISLATCLWKLLLATASRDTMQRKRPATRYRSHGEHGVYFFMIHDEARVGEIFIVGALVPGSMAEWNCFGDRFCRLAPFLSARGTLRGTGILDFLGRISHGVTARVSLTRDVCRMKKRTTSFSSNSLWAQVTVHVNRTTHPNDPEPLFLTLRFNPLQSSVPCVKNTKSCNGPSSRTMAPPVFDFELRS